MRGYTQGPAETRVSSSPCCESVQTLLPPLFRWLAHASPIRLPHRRHYTPATEDSRCEELTTHEEFLRHGSNNLGAEGGDHVGYDGSNGKDVDDGLIPPTL